MKKLLSFFVLATVGIATLPVQAATSTGNFDVNINLTSACIYAKTADVVFNYTSFQAVAQTQTTAGGFTVRCTNLLPYTMALDLLGSYTDATVNLAYTLALSASGGTGNGSAQAYTVTGSMVAGQAGNCVTLGGACTNLANAAKQRTLTITY